MTSHQPSSHPGAGRSLPPRLQLGQEEYTSLYTNKEFRIYQDAIERLKDNEDQMPSLPAITLEVRQAVTKQDISTAELAAIIVKDPSLTAILMKHASNATYRTTEKPRNLQEVITRLGMRQVESLVLAHSIKSLFVLKDAQLKQLYKQAWRRQTLKACTSLFLARQLRMPNPDNALVASLLSEVGTLAMLVALQNQKDVPPEKTYRVLCRHYSKHLGMVLLAKWGMDRSFTDILRQTGQWKLRIGTGIQTIDVINLALYHTVIYLNPVNDLMPLQELAAFQKLTAPHNEVGKHGGLLLVEENIKQIEAMAGLFAG